MKNHIHTGQYEQTIMNEQKILWEGLAKENSRYYILGSVETEEDFKLSGEADYKQFILDDKMIRFEYPDLKKVTILDIGCGVGRMNEFMAKNFKKVIGTDISGEMIKQGQQRLKNFGNIELLENDGETLPLPDNCVDFAFSYWVYQHIKTKEMMERNFEEAYRVLKPNKLFKAAIRSAKPIRKESWWSGIQYNEISAEALYKNAGFSLLKQSYLPESYIYWLWLRKEHG